MTTVSPELQAAITLLESQGYKVTAPIDHSMAIRVLTDQIKHIDEDLAPRWGIQDEDALALERAVLMERRTYMVRDLNRLQDLQKLYVRAHQLR